MKHLAAECRNRRLGYWWVGKQLGGKTEVGVQNKLLSPEGQELVRNIHAECVEGRRRWALLCLEKCWQHCAPRSLIGRELAQLGVTVVHISMASKPEIVGCPARAALDDKGQVALDTAATTEPSTQVAEAGAATQDLALANHTQCIAIAGCKRWQTRQSRRSQQAATAKEVVNMAEWQQLAASTATSGVIADCPPWLSQLSTLVEWRREGLLDEEEFTAFKGKLLGGCGNSGFCMQFSNHLPACQSFKLHACSCMQGEACDA